MCYPPIGEIKPGMKMPADYLSRTGYRLPTEAEWEYACRAVTTTRRYYGSADELLAKYAWYQRNSDDLAHPAGQLKPNDLGLFDMLGNAWEWCQEKWPAKVEASTPGPRQDSEDLEPLADKTGRVTRGGSFANPASEVRTASRNQTRPIDEIDAVGFRMARTSP